eukprot:TRINITY_DN7946_c0_g2_i4.p1 TRINITY_DN7946_c0_g2~~TRINITY_DN7946_c0_g2_i4.p1  ORF type:complete len:161 (-),score=49.59 TRINITY_DN7946_c0_g2_i4:40-522(-)
MNTEGKIFSDDQYAEYKETFTLFDKTGNGTISVIELGKIMNSLGLGISTYELKEILEELDISGKDTIDFEGFLSLMVSKTSNTDNVFEEVFKLFDKNGDGTITAKELKEAMDTFGENLNDREVDEIFYEMDLDRDGKINYSLCTVSVSYTHLTLPTTPYV